MFQQIRTQIVNRVLSNSETVELRLPLVKFQFLTLCEVQTPRFIPNSKQTIPSVHFVHTLSRINSHYEQGVPHSFAIDALHLMKTAPNRRRSVIDRSLTQVVYPPAMSLHALHDAAVHPDSYRSAFRVGKCHHRPGQRLRLRARTLPLKPLILARLQNQISTLSSASAQDPVHFVRRHTLSLKDLE